MEWKIVDFKFDIQKWVSLIHRWRSEVDDEIISGMIGCDPATLRTWVHHTATSRFPYPSMTLFIKACNALDIDPRDFYILDE